MLGLLKIKNWRREATDPPLGDQSSVCLLLHQFKITEVSLYPIVVFTGDIGLTKFHEVFYIVAPDTTIGTPTLELAKKFYPNAEIRGDLSGNRSFFSSAKAERMLGWTHEAG